jgi:trk system potassium uptake protein TrkH
LLIEYNNPETLGTMSFGNKLLNSFFQSITFRTAGFASVNQAGLKDSTVFLAVIWMLIGGSPAGTAGGIKTVTAAVIIYTIISVVQGRKETIAFNKSINPMLVRRVLSVTFISILGFVIMSIAIMVTNDTGMADTIYETASAIGTVGLSRGITSSLNNVGKVIIIIGMYLGRIGPISMFVAFNNKSSIKNTIHYAEADIIVG